MKCDYVGEVNQNGEACGSGEFCDDMCYYVKGTFLNGVEHGISKFLSMVKFFYH